MSFYSKRFNNIKANNNATISTNAEMSLVSHNTWEKEDLHEQSTRTSKYGHKILFKKKRVTSLQQSQEESPRAEKKQ